MENKTTDINELVLFLAAMAMKPLLDDGVWQCYGYAKTPRRGAIWHSMFPRKFELENFITKEILTMGLIDVLNGIKKSKETAGTKLLISIGVVDQFLSTSKHLFPPDVFMENLFSTYASYLKSEKSKIHEPLIIKAKEALDKKHFARFMVGTIKLFLDARAGDFLLKSDYFKEVIERASIENELKISMSDEMYKQYSPLIEEKVLNS